MFLKLLFFVTVYVIDRGQGYSLGYDVCHRLEQCPSRACQNAASLMHLSGGNTIINNIYVGPGSTVNIHNYKLNGAAGASTQKKLFKFLKTKLSEAFGPDAESESIELIAKTTIQVLKEREKKHAARSQQNPNNFKRLCLLSPSNDYCVTQTKRGPEVLLLRSSLRMHK